MALPIANWVVNARPHIYNKKAFQLWLDCLSCKCSRHYVYNADQRVCCPLQFRPTTSKAFSFNVVSFCGRDNNVTWRALELKKRQGSKAKIEGSKREEKERWKLLRQKEETRNKKTEKVLELGTFKKICNFFQNAVIISRTAEHRGSVRTCHPATLGLILRAPIFSDLSSCSA